MLPMSSTLATHFSTASDLLNMHFLPPVSLTLLLIQISIGLIAEIRKLLGSKVYEQSTE